MQTMALMTVEFGNLEPSLNRAAELLGVRKDCFDLGFGLVPIDPARGLFAVRIDSEALRHSKAASTRSKGPFSNPKIGTMGD